jgi:hypothetical protein
MKDLMVLFAIALVALCVAHFMTVKTEPYMDFVKQSQRNDPDLEYAPFQQDLPLTDILMKSTGLTSMSAVSCAATDSARQMEMGGQYIQRTNNYRRDYPDHCSSLLSDFVGGFYAPKAGAVGSIVPCTGFC